MSNPEIDRLEVLQRVLDGRLTQRQASVVLDLGERQVQRLSFLEELCVHALGDGTAQLTIEWRSYAMDWMGDATHVGVEYGFATLAALLHHVEACYGHRPTDLTPTPPPLPATTPLANGYPEALVATFQDAWRRLRADFRADRLLTPALHVVGRFDGF